MVNSSRRTQKRGLSAKARDYTLRLVRIAIFVALITVGAFIKIPLGIVPAAMQLAFCVLSGLMLGAKDGLVTVLVYLGLGLAGVPIFTAGGGIFYVFQPTFGYMLGYVIAIPLCGIIARGLHNDAQVKFGRMLLGAVVAMLIIHAIGVVYMYCMLNFYIGKEITFAKAVLSGSAIFLPTDTLWCIVGSVIACKVLPYINKKAR